MGSDLETGAVKGRAGDSHVAADKAMFESLLRIRDTGGDTEVGERQVPLDQESFRFRLKRGTPLIVCYVVLLIGKPVPTFPEAL
jgi:hypothetical protein